MNKILAICVVAGIGFTACNNGDAKEEALAKEAALKEVKDSLALDSFRKAEIAEKEAQEQMKLEQEADRNHSNQVSNNNYQAVDQGTEYDTANEQATQPVATNKKKGWSDAAKGTAIGAGVGAGVGALIDKDKRLRGAAIGAAIGGAGGYAVGRKSDRKSGRVQKK